MLDFYFIPIWRAPIRQQIKSNNNQYQFLYMLAHKYSQKAIRHRQISFSDWEDPSFSNSMTMTPTKLHKESSSANGRSNASPLHNLHYKYLPENYVSPEKTKENTESRSSSFQPSQPKSYVDRTEGINKINSKIKNILQSIEQEQKRKEVYVHKYGNDPLLTKNTNKEVNCTKQEIFINSKARNDYVTPLRDKNMNGGHLQNSAKYSNLSSIKAEQKQNHSIYRENPSKLRQSNVFSDHQLKKSNYSSYQLMNSRYLNYSASRTNHTKQDVVVNGKNVDREIDKIQKKIQQLAKIKEIMGVNPSHYPNSVDPNSKTMEAQISEKPVQATTASIKCESKLTSQSIQSSDVKAVIHSGASNEASICEKREKGASQWQLNAFSAMAKSQLFNTHVNFNEQDVKLPKILRNLTSKRNKQPKQKTQQTQITQSLPIQSTVSQFFNTNTQTPQSLQTGRHPTPQIQASHINDALTNLNNRQEETKQLKRLLLNLQKQIKADQEFRKGKKWLQKAKNSCKWEDLQKELIKNGINMENSTIKEVFSITSEEESPFYSPRQFDFTFSSLVEAFKASEQTWSRDVVGGYSRQKLKQGSFVQSNIDICGRGHISIEDIVRFVNYQMDAFNRNRDLYLIYHRFKKAPHLPLKFQQVIQCLTDPSH